MKTKRLKRIVLKKNNEILDKCLSPGQLQGVKGGYTNPPNCYNYCTIYCDVVS